MDPNKTEPVAPTVADTSTTPNPISVAPFKEAAPASVGTSIPEHPQAAQTAEIGDYLKSSNPEATPAPEVAPFARPVQVTQPPQQVINNASSQIVSPQAKPGTFPTNVKEADVIINSKKYSIKDAIKWFATLLKFENLRRQDSST